VVTVGKHAADLVDVAVPSRAGLPGRVALSAAAVIVVIGAGVLVAPQAFAKLPWALRTHCAAPQTLEVVVAPELESLVDQILSPQDAGATGDTCVAVQVNSQEPQETVASSGVLPIDRAPQIWIPDDSVWGQKALWPSRSAGSLARTPVVIATSAKAVQELGWSTRNPTWAQALRARPVAVSDYRSRSESLDVLIALWQTLGRTKQANEVAGTVLAADRQELPTPAAAIDEARSGSSSAPLLPSTEQAVAHLNATSGLPNLKAVYPSEGSPVLDYPILQITGASASAALAAATRSVITRLTSPRAGLLAREAGFRGPQGGDPFGAGITPTNSLVLKPPDRINIDGMISRLDALAAPSRILTVMDVSQSMKTKLSDGVTRIALEGEVTRLGVNLLPDRSSLGTWLFASNLNGAKDYRVLNPVQRLGSHEPGGETHRSLMMRSAQKPERYLSGGGTALYDVTIAAFEEMHAHYDAKADNAIILISDGPNEDPAGADLAQVLAVIQKLNRGRQKVAIYTTGLGPDADYPALRKIADASGGYPYRIDTALEGQRSLLDGLNRSRHIGTGTK
jgi:Ca-activated chloride channel family protein